MKRKLRSNLEPGTTQWAVRRAQWRALGLTDADMEKPKIAIVNTSSGLSSCFAHLDVIAERLKTAIKAAGGWPFEVRTTAPSDFVTSAGKGGRYILPSRDLIANDIEAAVEGAQLDGMICLASCDKTAPGQLMAAARLDIPSIVLACGYQPSGIYAGERVDIEDAFESVGRYVTGAIDLDHLTGLCDSAIRGPGVCSGMGTANSMHVVAEALGMALPGTTPVLANSAAMWDAAGRAGRRIVEMVWEDARPRAIMTAAAFANAVKVVLAVSASINTIRHLQAIAVEAQCPVDLYALLEEHGRRVPLLCAVRPNGAHTIEQFEAAGGTVAVMRELAPLLDGGACTVTGDTVSDNLARARPADGAIIRTLDRPLSTTPALVVLRGTLTPGGGIVKVGTGAQHKLKFEGVANVYESQQAALEGLKRGDIRPGQVVVLRGMGPKGGPGVALASGFVAALDGAGLDETVAVVTDGQLSGLNRGLAVGQVSPEAAEGGPLALVASGDRIRIDIHARSCNLDVPETELAQRRAQLAAWTGADERGWLAVYRQVVQPLARGAVLFDSAANGKR